MAGAYAGDLSPDDALSLLAQDPKAVLVDVRTRPEWTFVGVPDLSGIGKEVVLLEWQSFPTMAQDPAFVATLRSKLEAEGLGPDSPILFLCRSGARSRAAAIALANAGFNRSYNISEGFEGAPDAEHHRGALEGWKARGLPWAQS